MTLARYVVLASVAIGLWGCAAERLHREGVRLVREGEVEDGLTKLEQAVAMAPDSPEMRKDLYLRRSAWMDQKLAEAQRSRREGADAVAEAAYQAILAREPTHAVAIDGLKQLDRERQFRAIVETAQMAFASGQEAAALEQLRPVLMQDPEFAAARDLQREIEAVLAKKRFQEPVLRPADAKPIHLDFRDASVRMVFEALSRSSGINFILDKDISPELKTTVFLRNTYVDEAIDLVLRTSQLQRKLLGNNTVLIYPDTLDKAKIYQDLVVRAFYLHDASATQMQATLKTLLKTKDIVIDEKLNLLVMRDTPEAIRLAEKLIALHDLSEPEVMLEMEVIEVQQDALLNLGVQWPSQLTLTPLSASSGNLTLADLKALRSSRIGASVGSATLNLRQDSGLTNLLANPRVRVRNREKAMIMIGDKVPVVTTTSTATGFVAESVQYLDVGLKLNVEPTVFPPDDVGIKVSLEVSSIAKQLTTPSGSVVYQIGSRNASTVLRLKDGQTQILAGLINDQDRKSASGIPGLSQLPLAGRLFSSPLDTRSKNEIVLSITPRMVRNVSRPDPQLLEFWSGTENVLRTTPLRFVGEGAAAPAAATTPP